MPNLVATGRGAHAKTRSNGDSRNTEGTTIKMEKLFEGSLQFDKTKHGVLLLPPTFRSTSVQMRDSVFVETKPERK